MDSRAIFRMDIGFYMRTTLRPLLVSLHGVHVLLAYQMILTVAHIVLIGREIQ